MKIQVIGPGCSNCQRLYAQTQRALAQAGMDVELEKVENHHDIMATGVWMTPGLAINGEVKASGRIPQTAEIVSWIMTAAAREG